MAGLGSFEFLMGQILLSDTDSDKAAAEDAVRTMQQQMIGVNSMISPLRENAAQDAQRRVAESARLRKGEKKQLFQREHRELMEVITFFCTDRGCQHSAGAEYLSTGRLGDRTTSTETCKTQCAICTGKWHKQYLPFYRVSLVRFLQSSKGREYIPFVSGTKLVSDMLWGDSYWLEQIFDRAAGGLKRTQVDGLFLSLAAVGILKMEKNKHGIVVWNLAWDTHDSPAYNVDSKWVGLNLHDPARVRKRLPLVDKPVPSVDDSMDTSN